MITPEERLLRAQTMHFKTPLLGVVLCGGESKRMGRDKGLLTIGETTWAQHVAAKLEALQLPVVVSVNATQVPAYQKLFIQEQLVVDCQDVAGPLNGLLSVHQQYPNWDLLLMACDMVEMQFATLYALVRVYQVSTLIDFFVYQEEDFAEPFGAIYTARGLRKVASQLPTNGLPRHSLRSILEAGNTRHLPIISRTSFSNYNSSNTNP